MQIIHKRGMGSMHECCCCHLLTVTQNKPGSFWGYETPFENHWLFTSNQHCAIIFLDCFMMQCFVCTILLAVVNYPTIKTEIEIMKELRHERLLRLYAVCTTSEPICLVTELMKNGSLKTFLISKWTNIKLYADYKHHRYLYLNLGS